MAALLVVLGGLLLAFSLLYIPFSRGTVFADAAEVVLPAAISLALVAFSFRLRRRDYHSREVQRILAWSWLGLLATTLVGGWWVVVTLSQGSRSYRWATRYSRY